MAVIAKDLKAKINQASKYEAPKTNQLLTVKLERDIDTLLLKWLGESNMLLTQDKICELLTNFGVF